MTPVGAIQTKYGFAISITLKISVALACHVRTNTYVLPVLIVIRYILAGNPKETRKVDPRVKTTLPTPIRPQNLKKVQKNYDDREYIVNGLISVLN